MSERKLKFGAAPVGVGGPGQQHTWLHPEIPGDASVDIRWYADLARRFEEALFDFVFVVDSQFITADSPPHYLNRLEPLTLLSALAVATTRIGLAATITTSYTAPFHVARQLASLDLISGGRAGWNVVTSLDPGTARNYDREEHLDYATRYSRALEHVTVARGLWDSYEDDAFPRDKAAGVFFDPSRQHALGHRGEHFSVQGPLNVERSAQGQPVVFQAGDSEEGRDLAATVGEGIFTMPRRFEEARAFYAEMKDRAAAKGRDPDDVLILPSLTVVLADTDEEARAIDDATYAAKDFARSLAEFGRPYVWHDFAQYDPDAPFPDVARYGETSGRTITAHLQQVAAERGLTLRETVLYAERRTRTAFVGAPRTVADEIERWFLGRAADGFIMHVTVPSAFDRFAGEVLPILRERGLFRTAYEADTLRGNLGLPVPENVHTALRRTVGTGSATS
ncbi:NtaA/DmoA family FMN-dependent monooxygenase [Patulibacter minatonensis]|uniref:NtaA/DmoA family FMN-dependent monooxygenase n=1 Tax=Patulibacter minatonensis TaxID=298163 RepID=UPI00047B19AF|nr:NtaA/DmoA family FMN-dependent monooxygenase [Patulibacter minatonensis]